MFIKLDYFFSCVTDFLINSFNEFEMINFLFVKGEYQFFNGLIGRLRFIFLWILIVIIKFLYFMGFIMSFFYCIIYKIFLE